VRDHAQTEFPHDPDAQLWGAVAAVFQSWNSPRAVSYRAMYRYPDHWGTAVNVQAMVFGNMGVDCATGVAFTRDPSSGEKRFFGEYLVNAQGEDVVAGTRTPLPVGGSAESLEARMPAAYRELVDVANKLEHHFGDVQDVEFTIESGRLWMLQTRNAKRTGRAAVRIAVDMVEEGMIDVRTAMKRVAPEQIDQLLHPTIDPERAPEPIAKGLPASPGAASGRVVFAVERAVALAAAGEAVVLVRNETSPEDIDGMKVARAILTATGGMASHAALVARGMGKCCVVGCSALQVDYEAREFKVDGRVFREGDEITVEGSTGKVYAGRIPARRVDRTSTASWSGSIRCGAWGCAPTPTPRTRSPRRFGAGQICAAPSTCSSTRIASTGCRMILASTRRALAALEKILPMTISRACFAPWTATGHDSPARSAAARNSCPRTRRSAALAPSASTSAGRRSVPCTSSTLCSATAVAGSASPSRKCTKSRCAPSSRRRARCSATAST
jgi:pyruvate,orthophosphate dikinase